MKKKIWVKHVVKKESGLHVTHLMFWDSRITLFRIEL